MSVALDGPGDARSILVLGHGAGGDMHSEFMSTVASLLAGPGVRVCRFNFPYSEQGRRAPDRHDVLQEAFEAVVEEVSTRVPQKHVFVGGKSLGGRIASHAVAEGVRADGVIFLGYPLHPPGRPERLRTAHLSKIKVPMLFVAGTRDPFCPLDTLQRVIGELAVHIDVAVVDDGDHSLKVRKASGRDTKEAWAEAAGVVAGWLEERAA